MKKINWTKVLPHVVILAIFLITSMIYFYPALSGQNLSTHDIKMYKGMSKEISDFREEYNEEPLWTNSMFAGMPADQISIKRTSNLTRYLYDVYTLWLPSPISKFWALLLGFYILLMCLKVDPWLALIGSLGYAFSSYFLVSMQAGHMTKVNAISFMAPTVGSFILLFKGRIIEGGLLASLFLSLLLWSNHPQIAYYTFFIIGFVAFYYLSKLLFEKDFKSFTRVSLVSVGVILLSISTSLASLWGTYEYTKETIRGQSDLTLETPLNLAIKQQEFPDSPISKYREAKQGLDDDYILAWSYGTGETFTFMFPNIKGGGNNYEPANTKTLEALYPNQYERFQTAVQERLASTQLDEELNKINYQYQQKIFPSLNNMPSGEMGYYGQQGLTNGPVFIGVILCLLAFLGLVVSDGKLNYYLFGALALVLISAYMQSVVLSLLGLLILIVLSILNKRIIWHLLTVMVLTVFLGWGKNYLAFSEFFIDYFPMYSKFRAVTMILVVAELIIPLMAIIFLVNFFKNKTEMLSRMKILYIGVGVFTIFVVLVALNPDLFFNTSYKTAYQERTSEQVIKPLEKAESEWASEAVSYFSFYNEQLHELRFDIARKDALMALFFVVAISLLMFLFLKEKITKRVFVGIASLLVLIELVPVDLKYLNTKKDDGGDFIYWSEDNDQAYVPNNGDVRILELEMQKNPELKDKILNKTQQLVSESADPVTETDKVACALSVLNSNTDYRVYSMIEGLTGSTRTSYYHKSLGGYHGAKLMRYQDLIDFHIEPRVRETNELVLDMLNTRYLIGQAKDEKGNSFITAQERPTALGAAWIVSGVNLVDSTNHEIEALYPENGFDPKNVAVVHKDFAEKVAGVTARAENSDVNLLSYKPNELVYSFESSKDELVVFSEIYYPGGWQAYIDDQPVDHFRVNYILRGMVVPAGEHQIRFEYRKKSYEVGSIVSLIASSILVLLVLLYFYLVFFKEEKLNSDIKDETVLL